MGEEHMDDLDRRMVEKVQNGCVVKLMTNSIRIWDGVLDEEGLCESLEVDENAAWRDAVRFASWMSGWWQQGKRRL